MADSPSTLHGKLLAVQAALKAPKNQENTFGKYKYRSCEDILEAVKPLLKEHGLLLNIDDEVVMIGDRFYVKATALVMDEEGDDMTSTAYAREEAEKKGMDGSQITGAASSYARKYALNGLFLIDDTKDADATDGNEKPVAKTAPAKPAAKKPVQPTRLKVMEDMNAAKNKTAFQSLYDGAFTFPWSEEDARSLGECYVSGVCRFANWMKNGTDTKLFDASGVHVADVVKDEKTGKLAVKKVTPAEKAMADAEQAGKAADSTAAA
jgi:hypothetical protein